MAIEKFTWPTGRGETPDINYRVRSSKFGNGYAQNVGDGPNNKEDSYPITCVGHKVRVQQIMAFLDRHAGAKAFLWTTPLGELGLFTCKNPAPTPMGGGVFKLTATFERAFQP
ncbi:phage tail protein [Pseudomonas sp. TNT2022 ID642]|uniref:phage tail protein n=1 Tax=Pseudomonas sp. TNT2022 ID642 TaxID=2942632 RepID=UPI00235EA286|nr:phage tail protein [Pseudomonas sp. TNT2022 ID642]MDD1002440.1 phage tail protein [Pseudomonas sp. TNT2022 ID642]